MSLTSYYSIVRYVPDVIRDEAVNIGVIIEAGENGDRRTRLLCAESFHRAAKLDPNLNSVVIERIIRNSIEQLDKESQRLRLEELADNYGGGKVQLTQPRLTIVDDLDQEIRDLYEQYIVEEKGERRHGVTEPILKREVREVLTQNGVSAERIRVNSSKEPIAVHGKRGTHRFDMSVQVNSHNGFIRCISFDVEDYLIKLNAAKVLVYDAKDVKEKYDRDEVISILYPPKRYSGKERELSFREASLILKDEGVPAFDFSSRNDLNDLLALVKSEGNGHR